MSAESKPAAESQAERERAHIEQRADDFLEGYRKSLRIRDGKHKAQIIVFAAAFAASEVRAAIAREREAYVKELTEIRSCINAAKGVEAQQRIAAAIHERSKGSE